MVLTHQYNILNAFTPRVVYYKRAYYVQVHMDEYTRYHIPGFNCYNLHVLENNVNDNYRMQHPNERSINKSVACYLAWQPNAGLQVDKTRF